MKCPNGQNGVSGVGGVGGDIVLWIGEFKAKEGGCSQGMSSGATIGKCQSCTCAPPVLRRRRVWKSDSEHNGGEGGGVLGAGRSDVGDLTHPAGYLYQRPGIIVVVWPAVWATGVLANGEYRGMR
jgi:hypothetical protein